MPKQKKEVSVTDTPDKSFIKNFILTHSHIDTIEELEKLAPLFVEKIIVDKSEIYVTFKLELVGALGGKHSKMIYLFRLHLDRNYKQICVKYYHEM